MHVKTLFLCCLTFLTFFTGKICSQERIVSIHISNNTTGLPFIAYPDLFYSAFHPGIGAAYGRQLNSSERNRWYVEGNIDFYYHQFVQSLVRIYPNLSYQRDLGQKFVFDFGIGAGYGLSFEGKNAFVQEEDGSYQAKRFWGARSQYLIAMHLGFDFKMNSTESSPLLSLELRSFMQGTYVKSYVPLLPTNSINIGIKKRF